MDLDNKIKKFEQSCERLAQIDAEKLNISEIFVLPFAAALYFRFC